MFGIFVVGFIIVRGHRHLHGYLKHSSLPFLFVEEQDRMILHLLFRSICSSIINRTGTENRLPGLIFADDMVLLDSALSGSEYLTHFEMEIGNPNAILPLSMDL